MKHSCRHTCELISKGHAVTVISSKEDRRKDMEALGAAAAISSIYDLGFLTKTFNGADIVYLIEPSNSERFSDPSFDVYENVRGLVTVYKQAVERAAIKKIVHLSSIGNHTGEGVGILKFHHIAETILRSLPADMTIRFMRPVGFTATCCKIFKRSKQ